MDEPSDTPDALEVRQRTLRLLPDEDDDPNGTRRVTQNDVERVVNYLSGYPDRQFTTGDLELLVAPTTNIHRLLRRMSDRQLIERTAGGYWQAGESADILLHVAARQGGRIAGDVVAEQREEFWLE